MNDNPEAEIKASYDGEEYVLRFGGREARLPRVHAVSNYVAAAATLSGLDSAAVSAWLEHPGQDAERWVVQPKHVFAVVQGLRISLEEAASLSRGGYRAEDAPQPLEPTDLDLSIPGPPGRGPSDPKTSSRGGKSCPSTRR